MLMNDIPLPQIIIRPALAEEYQSLSKLLVQVYSQLKGFPSQQEHPSYYALLTNVGELAQKPSIEILVAVSPENELIGGVMFIGDIKDYSSGGVTLSVQNAAGMRLLAVAPSARGKGIGKALTQACIQRAKDLQQSQIILHSTLTMQIAWDMYQRMGFQRMPEIDFPQNNLTVYGFYLNL